MTMHEVTAWRRDDEKVRYEKKIIAAFGAGKVVATDVTEDEEPGGLDPQQWRTFDGRRYCRGWFCPTPEDKTWVLEEFEGERPYLETAGLDLGNPAALKALLTTTRGKRPGGTYDGTRTTIHYGTLTFSELYRISPAFRDQHSSTPTGAYAKIKLSWQLWLGRDQLVHRVRSVWTEPVPETTDVVHNVVDARLTRWGPTQVPEPRPHEVAGRDDWRQPPQTTNTVS
ncbi:hypothetical protein FH608_041190 [Nonomuraea phyllanthi]|uniref:Uncharacterized protein n=1 Tax=Nonomuraea phyllanthi TaxID=2219224 RepID=A0A5C4VJ85_9ACTN|nr:hypothetical protein [Nonomuraea phyllanthi]KAB8189242.1 hypothetical protein FH608_041190 [Nonomuraea phyllanthi]QFY10332.1 hypothetical protein GBF35_30235 [Nonomuraea phyllanthi]